MKLTLRHQILLAPTVVLLLLALLLGFMQYNYWDMTQKRQQIRRLGTVFIALAEADMATQRIYRLSVALSRAPLPDVAKINELRLLYQHLDEARGKILDNLSLPKDERQRFDSVIARLDPSHGFDAERFVEAISDLRPLFVGLAEQMQNKRAQLTTVNADDIDELVAETTFVSILVLATAIVLGLLLSLTFARHILRRIQSLSESARRIAGGDLTPPQAPGEVCDEIDELTLSISSMAEKLIRVVSAEKLLEGAEEERRRIAMDLHDQTLADLASVKRGVEALQKQPECSDAASDLNADLQRAIDNLREVMDNLHPQTLDILGLGAAIESHLERHYAREDLPTYHFLQTARAERANLPRTTSLALFRIAIEAVYNVVRHARSSRYEVLLDVVNNRFLLSVEDNGRGFDFDSAFDSSHRGLHNIRERARALGAQVMWKPSRYSSGTRFELALLLPPLAQEN
jgi:signal transduction histidine kinase